MKMKTKKRDWRVKSNGREKAGERTDGYFDGRLVIGFAFYACTVAYYFFCSSTASSFYYFSFPLQQGSRLTDTVGFSFFRKRRYQPS